MTFIICAICYKDNEIEDGDVERMRVQECTQNFNRKIGVVLVKMDLEAAEFESADWIIVDI